MVGLKHLRGRGTDPFRRRTAKKTRRSQRALLFGREPLEATTGRCLATSCDRYRLS
jgi:hypothetical protein